MEASTVTWCVAYTQPMKELFAQEHLLRQHFQVYLPRFKKLRRYGRATREVLIPLFPRYIFVGIDLEADRWRSINGTRGVSHLLMMNSVRPAQVPTTHIQALKDQEEPDGSVTIASLATFTKGQKLLIKEGVFKNQPATFEKLDSQKRIHVLLSFLGQETEISLPFYAVESMS